MDQRSSVSRPRVYWIAIAPCGFGHRNFRIRTAFWMGLFGGSCSQLVAKRQARTGFGCYLSFGAGDTVRVHRRSPEATRLRSDGLLTGYDFGSSASRPLRGSADGRTGIGVVFQPYSKHQPAYRELFGASGVGAPGRSVEGQPPVVLRQSWAHPSGCNLERRSSLVSFGTHLPTSNVPIRVRRTTACAIFGWQRQRPRPLDPGAAVRCRRHLRVAMAEARGTQSGAADTGSLSFGRGKPG